MFKSFIITAEIKTVYSSGLERLLNPWCVGQAAREDGKQRLIPR